MKNRIIKFAFAAALVGAAQLVHAQDEVGLIFGAEVGLQTTRFKLSEDYRDVIMVELGTSYSFKPELGFSAGIRGGYVIADGLSILTNVNYERNVYAYETDENYILELEGGQTTSGLVRFKEAINRVSFPVLARVRVLGKNGGLTLTSGLDMSIGWSGTFGGVFDDGVETIAIFDSEDFTLGSSRFDQYRGFNAGFVLGAGVIVPLDNNGDVWLTFDLKRKWGLTDQYTDVRKRYLEQTSGYSIQGAKFLRSTNFSVGVEIRLGGIY